MRFQLLVSPLKENLTSSKNRSGKPFYIDLWLLWRELQKIKIKMSDEGLLRAWQEKLYSYLDSTEPGRCWLWTGGTSGQGSSCYGMMQVQYPGMSSKRPTRVHRVSYMVKVSSFTLPRHLEVSHLCHTNLCCNPDHLVLESKSTNNQRNLCQIAGRCLGHDPQAPCIFFYVNLKKRGLQFPFVITNIVITEWRSSPFRHH